MRQHHCTVGYGMPGLRLRLSGPRGENRPYGGDASRPVAEGPMAAGARRLLQPPRQAGRAALTEGDL